MVDDGLGDHGAKPSHALAKPGRHPPVMQWQIGTACPSTHNASWNE
jgi:hypothetical protein